MTVIQQRLEEVAAVTLSNGSHESFEQGMCVMECVAYVAGEKWSDSPKCASRAIAAFLRSWNDSLADEPRNRLLKPLIPLLVGTKGLAEVEEKRSYMALDWMIRVFTPKWLDMVPALHDHAKALRDLEGIADMAGAAAAGVKVRAAWAAAREAAREAAGAAAWDAAGEAAWDAAREAAGAAAREAAGDAAREAAWAAAGAAAGAAARDAAWDALKPTTEWLQASALQLVHRMIEVK